MKRFIFSAFADLPAYTGGMNMRNVGNTVDVYLKNSAICLISAKKHNPEDTAALITNYELPPSFIKLLKEHGVEVIACPFETFVFPKDYAWSLAFYKLCALKHAVEKLEYDQYLLLDTDTVTFSSYADLWTEAEKNIMLFDMQHSLSMEHAQNLDAGYRELYGRREYLVNYGGEFLCGSRPQLAQWIVECHNVYKRMIETGFVTQLGDEFIVSTAGFRLRPLIKSANAYIARYWTGRFYLVSTNYAFNPVCILHLPCEKQLGILYLYRYLSRRGELPQVKKMARVLGLPRTRRPFTVNGVCYFLKRAVKMLNGPRKA